jgi:hypothetical protein
MAARVKEILLGYQPCQLHKNNQHSETILHQDLMRVWIQYVSSIYQPIVLDRNLEQANSRLVSRA